MLYISLSNLCILHKPRVIQPTLQLRQSIENQGFNMNDECYLFISAFITMKIPTLLSYRVRNLMDRTSSSGKPT